MHIFQTYHINHSDYYSPSFKLKKPKKFVYPWQTHFLVLFSRTDYQVSDYHDIILITGCQLLDESRKKQKYLLARRKIKNHQQHNYMNKTALSWFYNKKKS